MEATAFSPLIHPDHINPRHSKKGNSRYNHKRGRRSFTDGTILVTSEMNSLRRFPLKSSKARHFWVAV